MATKISDFAHKIQQIKKKIEKKQKKNAVHKSLFTSLVPSELSEASLIQFFLWIAIIHKFEYQTKSKQCVLNNVSITLGFHGGKKFDIVWVQASS